MCCLFFVANMAKLFHSSATEYGVVWTLAVEEQFYLLWPTVIHRLRRPRTLMFSLLTACVLAPLLRFAITLHGTSSYLLLPTNMDSLLYGALCALLIKAGAIHSGNIVAISRILLGAGLLFLLPFTLVFCFATPHGPIFWALWDAFGRYDPFCIFVAGVLLSVHMAQSRTQPSRSPVSRLFAFLGFISYGLYLVHPLLFDLYDRLFAGSLLRGWNLSFRMLVARFLLVSTASVLVAALSRTYYEERFLTRKKQLAPYAGQTPATESLP